MDYDYDMDLYRKYEVYSGGYWDWGGIALLEKGGYFVLGATDDSVEGLLKKIDLDDGLLLTVERGDGVQLKRLVDDVKDGWAVLSRWLGDECGSVKRCHGYSVSFNGGDEESAQADFVFLFRNDRAAKGAAEDYDGIADYIERRAFWDDVDIENMDDKGDLVRVEATVYFQD